MDKNCYVDARTGAQGKKMNKKVKKTLFGFCFLFLCSLVYVECTNKIFIIYPKENDFSLENNIVASVRHQESWIDIDIGTFFDKYGINCDLHFSYEEIPDEIKITRFALEIPSKKLKIQKQLDSSCYIGEELGYKLLSNNETILVEDMLTFYKIKHKNPFTQVYLYWRLYNAKECFLTYEIEYKIKNNTYSTEIKFPFTMKPHTSIRFIDTALSV